MQPETERELEILELAQAIELELAKAEPVDGAVSGSVAKRIAEAMFGELQDGPQNNCELIASELDESCISL